MADIITLKQICTELKLDPREARERLRAAARDPKKHPELAKTHKVRAPWAWVKGSPSEKEARLAVKGLPTEYEVRAATEGSTGEKEAREALPAVDINVGDERAQFVRRMVSIAQSERGMVVEFYQDTFGKEGLHFANFLLPGLPEQVRSGGQLIVRPDEARVCVEMRSAKWTSDHPTRNEYVEFSNEVFGPLLRRYNKEFRTHHRMRVERPRPSYQLPPQASLLFERFAILANTRSLHQLDWERFYLFVRNSRREAPEGALRPLLARRGFPAPTAQMLSELYHRLWAFKKLRA